MRTTSSLGLLGAVFVFACGEGNEPPNAGPLMSPGENCLSCHVAGGQAAEEAFTVAGTVFGAADGAAGTGVGGATVIITPASGAAITLTTNAAGNFFTTLPVASPFTVAVERNGKRTAMSGAPASGACASCHTVPGVGGAPGRIFAAP